MKIDVATESNDTTKQKGNLLEKLSKKLLQAQSFKVIEEIRMTGVELDLLCEHKVSGKKIYVECKAHKENLSATVIRQLLGTIDLYGHSEGWLISTAEFGKDAKGIVELWNQKPAEEASKMSFYYPQRIVESLQDASVIVRPPQADAEKLAGGPDNLGDWILLISKFGYFWCSYTLKGGTPFGVLVFSAAATGVDSHLAIPKKSQEAQPVIR